MIQYGREPIASGSLKMNYVFAAQSTMDDLKLVALEGCILGLLTDGLEGDLVIGVYTALVTKTLYQCDYTIHDSGPAWTYVMRMSRIRLRLSDRNTVRERTEFRSLDVPPGGIKSLVQALSVTGDAYGPAQRARVRHIMETRDLATLVLGVMRGLGTWHGSNFLNAGGHREVFLGFIRHARMRDLGDFMDLAGTMKGIRLQYDSWNLYTDGLVAALGAKDAAWLRSWDDTEGSSKYWHQSIHTAMLTGVDMHRAARLTWEIKGKAAVGLFMGGALSDAMADHIIEERLWPELGPEDGWERALMLGARCDLDHLAVERVVNMGGANEFLGRMFYDRELRDSSRFYRVFHEIADKLNLVIRLECWPITIDKNWSFFLEERPRLKVVILHPEKKNLLLDRYYYGCVPGFDGSANEFRNMLDSRHSSDMRTLAAWLGLYYADVLDYMADLHNDGLAHHNRVAK